MSQPIGKKHTLTPMGYVILAILSLVLIGAWLEPTEPPRSVHKGPAVPKLQFQRYDLGRDEHVLLIDIPDKYVPKRCAVYTNEVTRTSRMNCNFDDVGSPFPQAIEEE